MKLGWIGVRGGPLFNFQFWNALFFSLDSSSPIVIAELYITIKMYFSSRERSVTQSVSLAYLKSAPIWPDSKKNFVLYFNSTRKKKNLRCFIFGRTIDTHQIFLEFYTRSFRACYTTVKISFARVANEDVFFFLFPSVSFLFLTLSLLKVISTVLHLIKCVFETMIIIPIYVNSVWII